RTSNLHLIGFREQITFKLLMKLIIARNRPYSLGIAPSSIGFNKLHKFVFIDNLLSSQLVRNLQNRETLWYSEADCLYFNRVASIQLRYNSRVVHTGI